jgi:timeless
VEFSNAQHLTSQEHSKAAIVTATLVNLLSSELSLKPLVKRVNEDLRRDDMRVGPELELRYFDIIARLLHYNRLKLADDYKDFQTALSLSVSAQADKAAAVWEPNLKNVMDALDRMSFTRVTVAIDRMSKNALKADDVVIPLTLYKEMVCYLRVLMESGLEGHHEIAIAALHRLFYATTEKLDPLPKLLSSWKAGTFPRKHLTMLVELVHETLKTLETAHMRFKPDVMTLPNGDVVDLEAWAKKKYKRKAKGKNEMDLEQYVMACMRFRVDDYFKRIVSNQTVRMYTRLLSLYATNDAAVNNHVYCFLRRMNTFMLEQEHKTPSSSGAKVTEGPAEVSLSYMLFNMHTFEVFSTIINDREVYQNPQMEPLVRLIKAILRKFGEAAEKNRMLFVELLFPHARPHEFCCTLDSVYEAPAHAAYVSGVHKMNHKIKLKNLGLSGAGDDSDLEREASSDDSSSSSDSAPEDYGDEFDDTAATSAAFAAVVKEKKKKASSSKSEEKEKKRLRREKKQARKAAKLAEKAAQRASRQSWSAEEDAILREQYVIYAGTKSIFTSIAQHPSLRYSFEILYFNFCCFQ